MPHPFGGAGDMYAQRKSVTVTSALGQRQANQRWQRAQPPTHGNANTHTHTHTHTVHFTVYGAASSACRSTVYRSPFAEERLTFKSTGALLSSVSAACLPVCVCSCPVYITPWMARRQGAERQERERERWSTKQKETSKARGSYGVCGQWAPVGKGEEGKRGGGGRRPRRRQQRTCATTSVRGERERAEREQPQHSTLERRQQTLQIENTRQQTQDVYRKRRRREESTDRGKPHSEASTHTHRERRRTAREMSKATEAALKTDENGEAKLK